MSKNNLLAILDYCIIQIVPQMAQIDILRNMFQNLIKP